MLLAVHRKQIACACTKTSSPLVLVSTGLLTLVRQRRHHYFLLPVISTGNHMPAILLHFTLMTQMKPQDFIDAGKCIMNIANSRVVFLERWMSTFRAPPVVCCELWEMIDPHNTMPAGVQLMHLLWGLYVLRVYSTAESRAQAVGKVDEKTYCEWSLLFVDAVSYLESDVVSIILLQIFHVLLPLLF